MKMKVRAVLTLGVFILAGCSNLPSVQDPTQLVSQSNIFMTTRSAGIQDIATLPPALAQLHPVEVSIEGKTVIITTSRETGQGSSGYMVSGTQPVREHMVIKPTETPQLYSFDWQP